MDSDESGIFERRYIVNLPTNRFEAITYFYNESAEAELAGYPDARSINPAQAKLAETVLKTATTKQFRERIPVSVRQRVVQDPSLAPASEYCLFVSEKLLNMFDMHQPKRPGNSRASFKACNKRTAILPFAHCAQKSALTFSRKS